MAQSVVSICNMALGHIGRSTLPILSLTDPSVEARTCQLWYDIARQECLELYDWSFCRSRLTLNLHSDPPPIEWAYRYAAPANMLAFRGFWNPLGNAFLGGLTSSADGSTLYSGQGFWNGYYGDLSNAVPYLLELSLDGTTPTILTNLAAAVAVFTVDQQLVSAFSPGFINLLAWTLASKIAYPISGKLPLQQECEKAAGRAFQMAAGSDANQQVNEPVRDGYSSRARF
jgi:hypothetical protein